MAIDATLFAFSFSVTHSLSHTAMHHRDVHEAEPQKGTNIDKKNNEF